MNLGILIKCFNRPAYLARSVDSLLQNLKFIDFSGRKINPYFYVAVDGPLDINTETQIKFALEPLYNYCVENRWVYSLQLHQSNVGCAYNSIYLFDIAYQVGADYMIHIEDDHILCRDCIEYLLKVYPLLIDKKQDLFAACSYHRPVHQYWVNQIDDHNKLITKLWFDGSGPVGITRDIWKETKDRGGVFGIDYISETGRQNDCYGESWLKEIRKGKLSWVWPLHKYFSQQRHSIYPKISRSLNVGSVGLHCNPELHNTLQYNPDISDAYNIKTNKLDLKNITKVHLGHSEYGTDKTDRSE